MGLWLGRRLRPIPPHVAFQRKPERDHDQAEDDDRQHRERQAHHRRCLRSGWLLAWPAYPAPPDRMVGCRRPASPLAALGSLGWSLLLLPDWKRPRRFRLGVAFGPDVDGGHGAARDSVEPVADCRRGLDAGVTYPVVVGEGGTRPGPFGVRRQERVGRLSGTTVPPPSQDKTHEPTDPREHLFPRRSSCGLRVSLRVLTEQAYLRRVKGRAPSRATNPPGILNSYNESCYLWTSPQY